MIFAAIGTWIKHTYLKLQILRLWDTNIQNFSRFSFTTIGLNFLSVCAVPQATWSTGYASFTAQLTLFWIENLTLLNILYREEDGVILLELVFTEKQLGEARLTTWKNSWHLLEY